MSTDQPNSVPNELATPTGMVSGVAAGGANHRAGDDSEDKYRRLVEGLSGDYVIYTHDPDGVLTYVSPSVPNVLGHAPESLVGLNWRELIGEHFIGRDDAERVELGVAHGRKFYKFTVEIAHADGSKRLAEVQQRPLFDATGRYISMEGIAKDITEATRNAEELERLKDELEHRVADRTAELHVNNEKLHESQARYRSVVDDQTEFIVRWIPGGTLTFVNDAYCRYFDRKREDLVGSKFIPTIYEEDLPLLEREIGKLTVDNPISTIEHRVYRPDGTISWAQWSNRALFDADNQLVEYQSVGRDVTALKDAADTIREKEVHLAHVSRLATMGELVAGIAHEVHQPLHAAKTFAEAARRNLESASDVSVASAIECCNEISEAITRTAKIIRHLREFTRSRPVEFESLNLNHVVREASNIITYETRRARVKLQFNLEQPLPAVEGDRVQLEQACVNLLINAYEAMADTPVDQRQTTIRTVANQSEVVLSFQDAGCGATAEQCERLFDAFYSTKPGGMGMGLSLCKSIAEAHGGGVRAEPNDKGGLTVFVVLPIAQTKATSAQS